MPEEGPGGALGVSRVHRGRGWRTKECHVAVAHGADMVAVGKGNTLIILPGISGSQEQRCSPTPHSPCLAFPLPSPACSSGRPFLLSQPLPA